MQTFQVALDIDRQVKVNAETPRDAVLQAAAAIGPNDRLARAVVANDNPAPDANLTNFIVQEFDPTNPAANSNYLRRCEIHPQDDQTVQFVLFDANGRIGVLNLSSRNSGLLAMIAPQLASQWRLGRLHT